MAGSMWNAAFTLAGCPAVAVPCGFDQYGRPIGLQVAAPPRRDEVALAAAAVFERIMGLDRLLPIDPRPGTVPPAESLTPRGRSVMGAIAQTLRAELQT